MSTGKEAFESACQIGVAKSYNYRQLSQVFHGIDVAIQELADNGGGNIVISGSQPDGEEEGQIAFFQGDDGNYYEYIWVNGSWVNVKTQNEDVTVAGSAPFITISGTEIETQRDINHYLNEKIEGLIVDPSGEPINLEPFATKEYVDSGDAALGLQIAEISGSVDALEIQVSGLDFSEFATIEYVDSGDAAVLAEISGVNLETVLTNGNISDNELFLTNVDSTLIELSPTENVIGIAANGDNLNPKIRIAHIDEHNYRDSFAQLELDENGTRFDFEFNEKVDNVHFRFEDQEKLVLNKTGAAEFQGQVTVLPAEQQEHAATLGQVIAYVAGLQAAIDQLANSVEAGVWTHDDGDNHVDPGEYQLYSIQTQESYDAAMVPLQEEFNDCMNDAGGQGPAMSECQRAYTEAAALIPEVGEHVYTDEWQKANTITFAYLDADGEGFTFDNVSVGQYIDVVCEDGSGQMLGQITKVTTGMWYEDNVFEYNTISYKGKANGRTRVKIFSVNEDASGELTNFVHKTGDTLTGELKFNLGTTAKAFTMQKDGEDRFILENNGNETRFRIPRDKPFKFVNYAPGGGAQQIIKFYGYNEEQATNPDVEDNNGRIGIFNLIDPTSDRAAVNLGYMRDYVDSHFSGFSGEYLRLDGGVMSGNLVMNSAGIYTDAIIKSTRESGYAFQVKPADTGDAAAYIHTNGNAEFAHVKVRDTPTDNSDLTTKEYVDNQISSIPSVNLDGYATEQYVNDAVSDYLLLTGGTITGGLTIDKPRTDSNTNCLVVKGRIKDSSNNLIEGILLKSYKRQNSSSSADYLAYYGESGGDNEILNRTTAQNEFLRLSGGTLTGTLTGMLIKSIRETGYAFEIKPGNTGDATAFIHTNGDIKAKKLKVESDLAEGTDRPFELKGRLSDGSTVSKDFFYMYANVDGTPSAMNYDGKMNSDKNLVNRKLVNDRDNHKVPGHFTYENGHLFYNTGA